ncbi:rod shape-determining protein MreD [Parablautia intestinalis]|uniref:Rod shape-determining protein MreD n=1 Tax=Parablautia intestinalis TaxID=2320100 RepID=A0A3A9B220_9FIRM|nr:rod shape-determining protein MreD [Parablautia intestinalis]MCI8614422.1 rod shape-determining protein MreD [Lachnospiraceae bacterium]RKI92745.1 rod shape-determining protein MreD [Parablautia intestinalis]
MKRFIVCVFLIILCFLFQTTVFKGIALGGIVPNLMIILTASFGFMRGEKTGLIMGFFCGLLADIFFGNVLGLNAMIYMYIGYTNGKFNRIFFPEDIKLPLALILVSDLAYGFLYYITLFLMRSRFHIEYYFLHIILPEVVYTILITLLLYPLVLWLNKKLEESEKRSARKFV